MVRHGRGMALAVMEVHMPLIRLTDASELLVRPAAKDGAISALAWDRKGERLAFGTTDGAAGRLTLPG